MQVAVAALLRLAMGSNSAVIDQLFLQPPSAAHLTLLQHRQAPISTPVTSAGLG